MVGVELDHERTVRAELALAREQDQSDQPEGEAVEHRQSEIDDRHDDVDLEAAVGVGLHEIGGGGQLLGRDLRGDRRGEHQQHELARQGRIDALHRRQQHDVDDGLQAREAEAVGRLELGTLDRLDAGPHDLRRVGAHVHDQRDHGRDLGGELQPEARQAEIDDEDLHQQRRVADQLDIEADGGPDPAVAVDAQQSAAPCRPRARARSTRR